MVNYELLYIIAAKYTEDELNPIREKVSQHIIKSGGNVIFDDILGKKKLAYPIKKVHQGYYILSEFMSDVDKLVKLNSDIKLTEEVLRHIIVKKPERSEKEILATRKKFADSSTFVPDEKTEAVKKPVDQKKEDDSKIRLEDLDKKLDEILDKNII